MSTKTKITDMPVDHTSNEAVERAILSVILDGRHRDAWPTLTEICSDPRAFSIRDHRVVVLACAALFAAGEAIDAGTVTRALGEWPHPAMIAALKALDGDTRPVLNREGIPFEDSALAAIGGHNAVTDLAAAYAAASGLKRNAELLADHWRQRQALVYLNRAIYELTEANGRGRLPEIVATTISGVSSIMGTGQGVSSIGEAAARALKEHDENKVAGGQRAATWGLSTLDDRLPLTGGRLIVLAARPGCGKTSAMLQAAEATSTDGTGAVAIVTLEMGADDLTRILIGRAIGVSRSTIEKGWMSREEREAFAACADHWRTRDIAVKQHGAQCGPDDICAWIRAQHQRSGGRLRLVAIDYLQLITCTNSRQTENDRLGDITRKLKLLTVDLRITVLLLSQLNRKSATDNREPNLTDLRGSGCIEQDADAVVFLHGTGEPSVEMPIVAIVAKNRGGDTGRIPLVFHRGRGQVFTEIQDAQRTAPAYERMRSEPRDSEDVFL